MGGDTGPQVIVQGALEALRESEPRLSVVLIGDETAINAHLKELDPSGDLKARYAVVHAGQAVEMGEDAVASARRKKDSSLAIGMRLMKEGGTEALFSAGNTGATVAAALLGIGRIPGVHRPALATLVPADTPQGFVVMLDVGATADSKPAFLQQFALMGDLYAKHIMALPEPRIGLLNIGEESSKGNELARESHELLKQSPIRFIGNVEGRDIFRGQADVVVTDGFTGNVVLKFVESVDVWVKGIFRREISSHILARLGAFLLLPTFRALGRRLDYAEYGGAPLLGVNGVCIIGHGRSSAPAVKNAVKMAGRFVDHGLNERIQGLLQKEREQHVG
jgi:glycerol-3-phosphate acyltransferase PlsX